MTIPKQEQAGREGLSQRSKVALGATKRQSHAGLTRNSVQ
jgi:hypothetical protein